MQFALYWLGCDWLTWQYWLWKIAFSISCLILCISLHFIWYMFSWKLYPVCVGGTYLQTAWFNFISILFLFFHFIHPFLFLAFLWFCSLHQHHTFYWVLLTIRNTKVGKRKKQITIALLYVLFYFYWCCISVVYSLGKNWRVK